MCLDGRGEKIQDMKHRSENSVGFLMLKRSAGLSIYLLFWVQSMDLDLAAHGNVHFQTL